MKISCEKETGFVGNAVLIMLLYAERFCHEQNETEEFWYTRLQ